MAFFRRQVRLHNILSWMQLICLSGDIPLQIAASSSEAFYISKHSALLGAGKIKVTVLDLLTGKQTKQHSLSADLGSAYTVATAMGSPLLVWSEKPYKGLQLSVLGTSKIANAAFDSKSGEEIETVRIHFPDQSAALPHILVHLISKTKQWAEIFHVDLQTGGLSKSYSLPATEEISAFAVSTVDANIFFTRVTESEISLYSSASHGILGRWLRNEKMVGIPNHVVSEVVSRGRSSFAVRVAETTSKGEWSLIRNGENIWSRPEMLAYVTAAVWAKGVEVDDLTRAIEAEIHSNPINAYIHRLQRHAQDLVDLPKWLMGLPQSIAHNLFTPGSRAEKDMLGSRLVVLATSRCDIVALDASRGGAIKWWHSDLKPTDQCDIKSLNTHNGYVTTYLSDGSTSITLNATDGNLVDYSQNLPQFEKLIQIPSTPDPTTIRVLPDGTPMTIEESMSPVPDEENVITTVTKDGAAVGWMLSGSIRKLWTLRPSPGFTFVAARSRPLEEPVASIGHVLGDRSVLYKYLSPNIALLTATSPTALTIYLVEAVTGSILYTTTSAGADTTAPISSIVSENWFAYSFLASDASTGMKSYQLVAAELYESDVANDRGPLGSTTNYSSWEPGAITKPYVRVQAFTVAEPIRIMATTQTTQGITSKQLLCALPDSNAIIGIPRHFLDPRRPIDRDSTPVEAEEGLFRYSPILELDPKFFLTHAREVVGVKEIMSSPSLLESTSLVFAYGHDIFGTSVSPSMAFDVLGKGFNKVTMLLTVTALAAGTGFLVPLVKKKQVDGRWKM